MHTGRTLDIATLLTWLATESLGAFMVLSWIASGGALAARRRPARPEVMSLPVLVAHAGLNAAGLLSWIVFVASGAKAAGWLALALMAPAIGLGISTVAIWTPYPAPRGRGRSTTEASATPGARNPAPGVLPEQVVRRALEDEVLSQHLVDELIERNLVEPSARTVGWSLRPLIPASHGALAIATFVLAVLSVVAAP
jgi:CRISPR/Cas system endoribonuclease Cas6 (RAMP superfamily)